MSCLPPTQHRDRLSARIACTACRRLKMKCVGAEKPPCLRCLKARRECIVQAGPQNRPQSCRMSDDYQQTRQAGSTSCHFNDNFPESPPAGQSRTGITQYGSFHEANISSLTSVQYPAPPHHAADLARRMPAAQSLTAAQHQQASGLPSVYSLSPDDVVESRMAETSTPHSMASVGAQSVITSPTSRDDQSVHHERYLKAPDEQHILDLVAFFNERLLHNLPFLMNDTLHDVPKLIRNQRPLAYCAAFVAARFVPGYKTLRYAMIPEISDIIKQRYSSVKGGRDQAWPLLQAFAILYAYANSQPTVTDPCYSGELSHWALKSTVEMYASRLSLYRSAGEVRDLLNTDSHTVVESIELRRYVFWLWLYTMSHHTSLLLKMPPTIVVDLNIRSASKLLKDLCLDKRALRILAEVELCLLWSEVGVHDQASNQWWCAPAVPPDVKDISATLTRFDAALDKWSERWLPMNPNQITTIRDNGPVYFHYRFTRFFISTYATRLIYRQGDSSNSTTGTSSTNILSPPIVRIVLRSIEAAVDCCTVFQDLSPLQRDHTRYIADAGFNMIAFPCFYIISAAEMLSGMGVSMETHLQSVKRVAELMIGSAVDDTHGPFASGKKILARLAATTAKAPSERNMSDLQQPGETQTTNRGGLTTSESDLIDNAATLAPQHSNVITTYHQNRVPSYNDWDSSLQQQYPILSDDWFFLDTSLEAAADNMFAFDGTWN